MNRTSLRIRLSAGILKTHGVLAEWLTATVVREKIKGVGSWTGDVQTFQLINHRTTQYCYAWAQDVGDNSELVMVLKTPPVNSPQDAVREYLLSRQPPAKTRA